MHGGDIYNISKELNKDYRQVYDFSANINPFGLDEAIKRSIIEHIDGIVHYPDRYAHELKDLIAERYRLAKDEIVVGNGAEELMYRLVFSYKKGLKVIIPTPTFMAYEESLNAKGNCEFIFYEADLTEGIGEDILELMADDIDIIYLCLPNNPVGSLIDRDVLEKIMLKSFEHKIRLVIDISFMDFVEAQHSIDFSKYIEMYHNILIINSFTKTYAIPGLRLGIAYTKDKEFIKSMERLSPTWSVNSLALAAGAKALELNMNFDKLSEFVAKERTYLREGLKGMGFTVYKSYANYLMFYCDFMENLYDRCLEKFIIIRRCESIRGLSNRHFRIAVRTHEENEYLLKSMKEIVEGRV